MWRQGISAFRSCGKTIRSYVQSQYLIQTEEWALPGVYRNVSKNLCKRIQANQTYGYCSKAPEAMKAKQSPVSFVSFALVAATGGGIVAYYNYLREEKVKSVKALPSVGKAAIGGPFTLIGPDGKAFSSQQLEGEFALLYFGFTFCPDICPAELEKIAEAVNLVEKASGRKIQPVFITVDPERDSVEQVKEYCEEFHPRLLGLSGSNEQITKVAKSFRVYYTKTSDDDEDYLIDHSIISYLIDPEGNFIKFFGKNVSAGDMSLEIGKYISQWKKEHPQYGK